MNRKSIIAVLMTMTMAFAFAACGDKPSSTEGGADQNLSSDAEVGMGSPISEEPIDEAISELGVEINVPESAGQYQDVVIAGDPEILERSFSDDGVEYTARVAKTAELTDISGMYYEWESQLDDEFKGCPARLLGASDDTGYTHVLMWYDAEKGVTISFSAQAADLNGYDISVYAEDVF